MKWQNIKQESSLNNQSCQEFSLQLPSLQEQTFPHNTDGTKKPYLETQKKILNPGK